MAALYSPYDDHAAINFAAENAASLATIVGINGAYSRRLGAQLSGRDGQVVGSLADGCLEREILAQMAALGRKAPALLRYGSGSPFIDFRLPCGAGLDIWVDPSPDLAELRRVRAQLATREAASLALRATKEGLLTERHYIPRLRLVIFGDGPEVEALGALGQAYGAQIEHVSAAERLTLGQAPRGVAVDQWTALAFLFHDHEWERALLDWALASEAFYIGAQGGAKTRDDRHIQLAEAGWEAPQIARVRSPVGLIERTRDPQTLALSMLAEIVRDYEELHPHQ